MAKSTTSVTTTNRSDHLFDLLCTFELVVPDGYNHATQLGSFAGVHRDELYRLNEAITDANFARATTVLTPGQRFKVEALQITKLVTSDTA